MTADATPRHVASTDGLGHNLRSQHKAFAHWFLGQHAKTALLPEDVAWEAWKAAVAAERERCARVCELRGRALEAARAHADGSLQGSDPKYWGPLLTLAAELAESIRKA